MEIDLIEILKTLKKKYKFILIITLGFTILPIVYYQFISKKVYQTSFSITSYFIQNREQYLTTKAKLISAEDVNKCISQFNSIYNYKKKYFSSSLPNNLIFKNLKDITTKTDDNSSSINVTLFLFDPLQTDTICSSLLCYLNNNVYFKKTQRNEEERLAKLINEYDKKVNEMELIKKSIYDTKQNSTNIYNFNIYSDIIEIQKRKFDLESDVKAYKGFEFVNRPLIPIESDLTYLKYSFLFLVFGFILSSLIVLVQKS